MTQEKNSPIRPAAIIAFVALALMLAVAFALRSKFATVESATSNQPATSVFNRNDKFAQPAAPKKNAGGRPRFILKKRDPADKAPPLSESQLVLLDFMLRAYSGEEFKLTREQVETWLRQAGRSAENLLAAQRLCGDRALLEEAARQFPHDSRVQLEVLMKDAFPEERQRWLEAFKQAAPDNALPGYLAARDLFKTGQPELAVQELLQASQKPALDSHTFDLLDAQTSARMSSGMPATAAEASSMFGTLLPTLSPLRELSRQSAELAAQYRQSGNAATADAIASAGLTMARQMAGQRRTLIEDLVGISIENQFLKQMDVGAPLPGGAGTVGERLAQLDAQRNAIKEVAAVLDETTPVQVSEWELADFFERQRTEGEYAALVWLRERLNRK